MSSSTATKVWQLPSRLDDIGSACCGEDRTPVWLPSTCGHPGVRQSLPSWDVTSDSLAAWLAGKLGADALLLIKQTGAFSGR